MNDNDVLGAVRDAMAEVHMHRPVQELVAAGRSRRRRRIAGTAAGGALATGLALTLAINSPQVNAPPVAAGNQVHVHLAAFSVDTNPDGTVTVKMTKQESLDPEIMQRTLAQAGIPAQITINKWCQPSDASQDLEADFQKVVGDGKQSDGTAMVITPSAMPPATKLIIGMRTDGYQPDSPSPVAVWMHLVPDDAPLTCTTDVPPKPASKS
ncbi:hypothetical protein [Microtetraspora malaysiensis]|uniref:FtsX extracellular domain-containing protein n=1 Tax=Microtetraspora malaysiensis TaxID=161358 RepID=A0ABW6T2R8_9ACTN